MHGGNEGCLYKQLEIHDTSSGGRGCIWSSLSCSGTQRLDWRKHFNKANGKLRAESFRRFLCIRFNSVLEWSKSVSSKSLAESLPLHGSAG